MVKLETQFWRNWKKNTPNIIWTRIENTGALGTPDLLGYNKNHFFFTVELKVTKGRKIRFSPHQIAFHVTHPKNSFILVQTLGQRSGIRFHLYRGSCIMELTGRGLELEACCLELDSIRDFLYQLGA